MASPSFGAALLSGAGAAPSKPMEEEREDPLLIPAQDLIDAVKTGDAAQVAAALRAANTMCQDSYGDEAAVEPPLGVGGE